MPDDLDARLRSLEQANAAATERDEMFERMFRELYPLVELYGRLDERFNVVLRDVGKAHEAIRELEDMIEVEREERRRGQVERKAELDEAIAQRKRDDEMRALEAKKLEQAREAQHEELASRFRLAVLSFLGLMITSGISAIVAIVIARGGR